MQIAPGLYAMTQEQGGKVHAFLIDDGRELTLIDTLFDNDGNIVMDEIRTAGRKITDLKHIILTHAHRSHIGGLAALKKASNAIVYSHQWEQEIVAGRRKATPVGLWPKPPLQVYKLQLGLALGLAPHVPCEVDKELKDADHIGPLEVVSTPGHTPGSLSFYWRDRKAVLCGDMIVTWPRIEAGWAGLTLDMKQNKQSLGKLSDALNAEIICSGHGAPITQGGAAIMRALCDGKPVDKTRTAHA